MLSAEIFCANCGAANNSQDSYCFACHEPLQHTSAPTKTTSTIHLLRQRYRVLERLGQGGMGSVYKAEDTELGNRPVAIKELSQKGLNQQESQEAEESFKHEALLLAGLMHPNLPRIYENFSESGRWYLVMDFIEGETLEDYLLKKGGKLPWSEIYEISMQLCSVLQYLHTRPTPIIFRDLKPLNVMLTPNHQVYLIDFGIARLFKPGQAHDTIAFGSPGYAAPEQYGKSQTQPSADIYSLGAMLHQMLTGIDPASTPFAFSKVPNIPISLQTLLNQMLDLNPNQRIEYVEKVKESLQSISTKNSSLLASANRRATPTIGKSICSYPGHMGIVTSLSWSPSSNLIASASQDKTVQIWDIKSGQMQALYSGNLENSRSRSIEAVAWSPGGKFLASASDDGIVQVWTSDSLQTTFTYKTLKQRIRALAWSPDGTLLASVSTNLLHIWKASNGETVASLETGHSIINSIAWSSANDNLVLGYDEPCVEVIHLTQQHSWKREAIYRGHQAAIKKVAWSPDGTQIASASADKTVQIWEAATGKRNQIYHGHTETVYTLDWSPDGQSIVSASADGTIQIWDAGNGTLSFTHPSHNPTVYAIAWSPNGQYIAASAHSHVYVWQATEK
ncbi:serine/threonine-protein kinase [Dictyobacter formicarum]|uniref:Protein kinase domain-containing protein n=1 Tax=Dictyobacter formicarum TaxID=2778368 RepID=A0ABQ3VMM7_9CHLR|nr:serine/threonine-protein kinase [Dictyobacter formicarum]GHO86651.1 hypothetical protein KSZ_46570 [Dictyobacter formicarum]